MLVGSFTSWASLSRISHSHRGLQEGRARAGGRRREKKETRGVYFHSSFACMQGWAPGFLLLGITAELVCRGCGVSQTEKNNQFLSFGQSVKADGCALHVQRVFSTEIFNLIQSERQLPASSELAWGLAGTAFEALRLFKCQLSTHPALIPVLLAWALELLRGVTFSRDEFPCGPASRQLEVEWRERS